MPDFIFTVMPRHITLGELTASAQVRREGNVLHVTVVLSSSEEALPLRSDDLQVQIFSEQNQSLAVIEQPKGMMPAIGSSLGYSSNALYQFTISSDVPTRLVVRYQQTTVTFTLAAQN